MNKQSYFLIDETRRRNALQHITQLPVNPKAPLVVTIQESTRTLEQNSKLWACLNDVSEQVIWHGVRVVNFFLRR
ncbi:recombination protein NinB [Sodalis endosymbiont of Spalangia cameroni]